MAIEKLPGALSDYTTLRVGGQAKSTLRVTTEQELIDVVQDLDQQGENLLILGGGSNVVCGDYEFPGTVIIIGTEGVDWFGGTVKVAAGENWDEFVRNTIDRGFGQLAPLSGIPGSMGATPIQNIGAYGVEIAEFIVELDVWDRENSEQRILTVPECEFQYRDSELKRNPNRFVVLAVTLKLESTLSIPIEYQQLANVMKQEIGTVAQAAEVREQVMHLRATKSMVLDSADTDSNSTGSFFINPVVQIAQIPANCPSFSLNKDDPRYPSHVKLSAAWLIEKAGITKGFSLGNGDSPIRVSRNHSLAITNPGQGSSHHVVELASYVRQQVFNRFDIELSVEPVLVNCQLDPLQRS